MRPRFGLVGIGDAGRHHSKALAAHDWTAVVARDPAKLAAFGPAPKQVFPSLDALISAKACDAVILATPDGLHAEQVVQAAEAGLAVLVEKPLALTRADGERAIAAARQNDVPLCVGYHLRHHAAHRLMREQAKDLRSIYIRWAWPDPATEGWRARGDGARFWSLAALGTHCIDLALWFTQQPPTRIASVREPKDGVDRAAELSFACGQTLVHISVAVTHRARSRVLLTGAQQELEALGTLGARGEGELVGHTFTPVNPYAEQLNAFAAMKGFTEDASLLQNLVVLDQA